MPYINTIDINGVIYTLENLTDGNNIVTLPELSRDDIFVLRGNIVDNTSSTSTIQPLSARQGKLLRDDLNSEIQNRINDVNLEEERATEAERILTANLNKEIADREADVNAEETRAQAAEKVLTDNLSAEVTRATNRENAIDTALTNEVSRATGAENTLTSNLNAEIARAKAAESENSTAISTEKSRAEGIESGLASRIATMEAFFKEADIDASKDFIDTLKEIQSYIESDKTGAAAMTASINANKTAIETEKSRAEGAESTLQSQITAEATTARAAEKANADEIAILNGSSDGSVAKAVADAKTELEAEINKKLDKSDRYVHPSYDVHESGLYKITVDAFGHISSVVAVSKEDIVGLGIPAQDTTYEDATADTSGLLSSTDKVVYDGYATTIENLQGQIDALRALIESYHGTVEEPEEPTDPEEPTE